MKLTGCRWHRMALKSQMLLRVLGMPKSAEGANDRQVAREALVVATGSPVIRRGLLELVLFIGELSNSY